jgi:hypothetical protein
LPSWINSLAVRLACVFLIQTVLLTGIFICIYIAWRWISIKAGARS